MPKKATLTRLENVDSDCMAEHTATNLTDLNPIVHAPLLRDTVFFTVCLSKGEDITNTDQTITL